MKKIVMAVAALLVAGLVGVVVYFAIPKEKPIDLRVEIKDVSLKVGENKEIEWTCNIEDALIVITSSKESVAKVERVAGVDMVVGCKVGMTELNIVAKYNGVKSEDKATVVVIEPSSDENPDGSDENPTNPPAENPEEGGGDPDNSEDGTTGEEPAEDPKNLEFTKLINCNLNEGKIVLNSGATYCYVQLSIEGGIEEKPTFEYDNLNLEISEVESLGANVYKIAVNATGEYEVKVEIDGFEYVFFVVNN